MNIIKRNGKSEAFDLDKVRTSIVNSSLDIGFPLTEGDLNMLLRDINRKIGELRADSQITSCYEVRGITYIILIECGFPSVAISYMDTIS